MCYIILARSIKRGFKTGVNLLRQVCTFVLSPFFMQKCDGIRHNYYLIQTERTVNFMTKNEVIELVKSGRLRGFLPPEMAQYEVNVEQMGSYTGIVLVNPEQKSAAYPVFNLDRAMERLQFINSEEEVAELLAGSMNRFIQAAPQGNIDIEGLREKLSSYEAAKPYIFMDAVSHNYSNDSTFSPFQPDSETLQSIMEMVSEVNETLEDEEILGYSVSIYDADKHELEKGTEYCINKQIDKVRNLRINELKEMGEIQPDIKPDNDNPKL